MQEIVVLIPAFRPDEQLVMLAERLHQAGLKLLIINDGSEVTYEPIFERVSTIAGVLRSPYNEGKGAALKRGIEALPDIFPQCEGFITADADGQHRYEDIMRVKERLEKGAGMVLAVRKLQGKAPAGIEFSNNLSRVAYTVLNGHYFDDNQSGLRGFAIQHREWLLKVRGSKYDYEMNVLCYADKQRIPIDTLPIKTIYIDEDKGSHFNLIGDTIRIFRRLFSTLWASFLGAMIWLVLAVVGVALWGYLGSVPTLYVAGLVSASATVLLNRYVIFKEITYRDGWRTYLWALLRAVVYSSAMIAFGLFAPAVPSMLALALITLAVLLLEYYAHMFRHSIWKRK